MTKYRFQNIIHVRSRLIEYETKYRVFNFLPRSYSSFPCGHLSILYRADFPYDKDIVHNVQQIFDHIIQNMFISYTEQIFHIIPNRFAPTWIYAIMPLAVCAQHQGGWPKIQNCLHQFIGKISNLTWPWTRLFFFKMFLEEQDVRQNMNKNCTKCPLHVSKPIPCSPRELPPLVATKGLIYTYYELCNKAPIFDTTKYDPTTWLIGFCRKDSDEFVVSLLKRKISSPDSTLVNQLSHSCTFT